MQYISSKKISSGIYGVVLHITDKDIDIIEDLALTDIKSFNNEIDVDYYHGLQGKLLIMHEELEKIYKRGD